MRPEDCLKTRPRSVAIVANGRSKSVFIDAHMDKRMTAPLAEEVWSVNAAFRTLRCDKLFLMDDLKYHCAKHYPLYAEQLKSYDTPIITATKYPEWPMSVEYPLEMVASAVDDTYLTNTVPYMLAYALATGVQELFIFGADYNYDAAEVCQKHFAALKSGTLNEEQFIAGVIAATAGEAGKDNLEYWMGFAKARGMVIHFPLESSLKDNVYRTSQNADLRRRYLYGYLDPKPVFHRNKSTGRLYMERANATGGTDTDGNGQHVAAAA
jgi:hypothetical protein